MNLTTHDIDTNRNSPRYIPDSRTNMMLANMSISRIEPTRAKMSTMGYNNMPSDESPFNPAIYADVQYSSKPLITNRNRVLSKYENNNPGNTNIALYDTRVYDLNATNVPALSNNQMQKNLMKRAEEKIRLKNDYLLPARGSKNASNGWEYNPYLPESDTNKPPINQNPVLLDERMIYHTAERPWNYASDRANIAYDLQRSEWIKERNRRQHEADDALFHRTKKDRWVEPKQAYRDRRYQPNYELSNEDIKQSEKQNERNTLTATRAQEAFVNSRIGFDENDINHLNKDIYGTFMPEYHRDMKTMYDIEMLKSRTEQFEPNEAKGSIVTATDYITKTISNFFGWNQGGNRDTTPEKYDPNLDYDEDGSLSYHFDHGIDSSNYNCRIEKFSSDIDERFYYKPDHMLVVKDGNLVETYPDEDYSYTAVSSVISDPLNTGLVRNIALIDNGKFIFVQKRAQDAIFDGDHRPIGDDLIVVELPVSALDNKFRERIKKYNAGTKRDKVLELSYEDFIQFSDWIVKHPEYQKRLKKEQLHQRVRTNKYDYDIVTNFEGKKTFVDEKVYSGLADQMRQRLLQHQKGRVDKEISTTEGYSAISPISSSNPTSINASSYRTIQHGGQLPTNRKNGVKRGTFDS